MSQVTTRPKTGTILQPKNSYHKSSNATDVSSWFYKESQNILRTKQATSTHFLELAESVSTRVKTFQCCFNIEIPGVDVQMMDHKTINRQESQGSNNVGKGGPERLWEVVGRGGIYLVGPKITRAEDFSKGASG